MRRERILPNHGEGVTWRILLNLGEKGVSDLEDPAKSTGEGSDLEDPA